MATIIITVAALIGIGYFAVKALTKNGTIEDKDGNGIPDVIDAKVEQVQEAAEVVKTKVKKVKEEVSEVIEAKVEQVQETAKVVKARAKRVKEEVSDVVEAAKEVVKQAKDIKGAAKGETRKGRKKKD